MLLFQNWSSKQLIQWTRLQKDIMLRKYEPTCIFCGEAKELSEYKGKKICQSCREIIGGNSIWKGELK